jgi:uncharacterized GH25 family protein
MRRTASTIVAIAGLLLLASAAASAQAWKGKGRLQGRVTDEDGHPLKGATVTVRFVETKYANHTDVSAYKVTDEGPTAVKTSRKGQWRILGLGSGVWQVRVEMEGYAAAEKMARVHAGAVGQGGPEVLETALEPSGED